MLSAHQLAAVMLAAKDLPDEKRRTFLERLGARLSLRGVRVSDADLHDAVRLALHGLDSRSGLMARRFPPLGEKGFSQ